MQMYMYFLGFPGDLTGVKVLVYVLFAIDTLQTVRVASLRNPAANKVAYSCLLSFFPTPLPSR